ncbi:hypothetical protein J5X84_38110 [Streptosporangiaceae bacterium NEAU-GS5]|nr:hypothetical protein [Streptosporangiaceae bacterium NEAU-GS5]
MGQKFARPGSGRVIHVTIPAEIADDLDRFQDLQRTVLDRLGCRGCTSGFDIRYDIARRFVVTPELEVRELG